MGAGRRPARHALREHRDLFLDKSTFSMDWYYPVLGGAVRGAEADDLLEARWDDFVVPGLGIRCVDTNPWVTGRRDLRAGAGARRGRRPRPRDALLRDMQHLRTDEGGYWTGYVYPDDVIWPVEHTTYTAAAVVLAVDALSMTTPGSGHLPRPPRCRPASPRSGWSAAAPTRPRGEGGLMGPPVRRRRKGAYWR